MDNKLISVIVPIYNSAQFLHRCIDSIIAQSYKNLQIMLIDDGSTDNSGIICDNYKLIDNRIEVYHKNNGGAADARNYGLDHMRGEYVTFVDSDDYIDFNMYEVLIKNAEEKEALISGCPSITEHHNGASYNNLADREKGFVSGKECILDFFYSTKHAWGACHNKIYDSLLFQNIRFPQINHFEDYVVSLQLFSNVNNIYFCNRPLYHYNSREGSVSKRGFYKEKLQILDTAEWMKTYIMHSNPDNELISGACYFLFSQYSNLLWETRRSSLKEKRKLILERKPGGNSALKAYLQYSKKKTSDIKMLAKHYQATIL